MQTKLNFRLNLTERIHVKPHMNSFFVEGKVIS